MIALLWTACSGEYGIIPHNVEPAPPPGKDEDPLGSPPDWQDCFEGWRGMYTNLTVYDDFVDPGPLDDPAPITPDGFEYWANPQYEKFEPTLDFGQNWWPIDEDLEGDPKFFAVYWHAWLRAWSSTDVEISLASQDDAWIYLNGAPLVENPGIHDYVRQSYTTHVDAGQYPIEVWFAHRGSENSGLSLRVVSGDVSVCYPDFGSSSTAP